MRFVTLLFLIFLALFGLYWYGMQGPADRQQPAPVENIRLYYYDPRKDSDAQGAILCSAQGLVPVERHLERRLGNLEETVRLLLRGELTTEERADGVTTEFPLDGFELAAAILENGTLTLTFEDPQGKTTGGACRTSVLWAQIEATARQFPGVEYVRFLPEDLFQP